MLGLSQDDVAQALDIPRPAISGIESCKRKVSTEELKEFAKLYRRDYHYLLDGNVAGSPVDAMLFRTATALSDSDKEQVLRFAEFLRTAGKPPKPKQP